MEGGSVGAGRAARYLGRGGACRLITVIIVAAFAVSMVAASLYPTDVFARASVILNGALAAASGAVSPPSPLT